MSGGRREGRQGEAGGDREASRLPSSAPPQNLADRKHRPGLVDGAAKITLHRGRVFRLGKAVLSQRIAIRWELSLSAAFDVLRDHVRKEETAGTAFLLTPVLFGAGTLIYFSAPREALLTASLLACMCIAGLFLWLRSRDAPVRLVIMLLTLVSGFTAAKVQTEVFATPTISRPLIADLTGLVVRSERRADGSARYTIDVSGQTSGTFRVDARRAASGIETVRVTARKGHRILGAGDIVTGKARLSAMPGPAYPGAYDFAFNAWFDGIGATGFFLGHPEKVASGMDGSIDYSKGTRISLALAQLRESIAQRIRDVLPGEAGALAIALITGDRSGIGEDTAEALRRSGLAHILAISGLHMALVTATVVLFVRGGLSLFPALALRYPIRKWAAGAALAAASLYLLISGASVSTQRAYVMIVIMLGAVLLDRRALTMRNVALAALLVLLLRPHAILTPGFQMSFAAVAALVATYEALRRQGRPERRFGVQALIWHRLAKPFLALGLTSLVAGIATGLFAAYHFQRIAPFGLAANLLAMPLVSVLVMPLALTAVLLMPFGLEQIALVPMSWAIEQVTDIARGVSVLEPAGHTGYVDVGTMLLGTAGFLVLVLLRSRLRFGGVALAGLAVFWFTKQPLPEVVVHENAKQVAIRGATGSLILLRPRADRFSTEIWNRAFDRQSSGEGGTLEAFKCDRFGCTGLTGTGLRVAHSRNREAFQEDCLLADVIIAGFFGPAVCKRLETVNGRRPPIVISRKDLRERGAHMIFSATNADKLSDPAVSGHEVVTAYGRFPRPWTAHRFESNQ